MGITTVTSSRNFHYSDNGFREPGPVVCLALQLFSPCAAQSVKPSLTIVFRCSPFGTDPASPFHAVERGIERALFHFQHILGDLLNLANDRITVHGTDYQSFQNQHVQRSLEQFWFRLFHAINPQNI